VHPVRQILEQRRLQGSLPGRREDAARVGLAIEGGGMRGVVSAAMLIALADLGFADAFDEVYGCSAGAINGAYFLQGGRWDILSLYYEELSGREFVDLRRPLIGEPTVDLTFLREEILLSRRPVSNERLQERGIPLFVAVTDVDAHRSAAVHDFGSQRHLAEVLVAGSWLPILAGPPPVVDGHRYLDGGVLLQHPAFLALRAQCTHVLVLSTRYPHDARGPFLWQRGLRRYLNHLEPGFGETYWRHIVSTRDHRYTLQRLATAGGAPPVLNVAPRASWRPVSRLEQRTEPLLKAAREGYEAALDHLTERPGRTVYSITRVEARGAVEDGGAGP
jgi:predicted patatin/cPLA2 family phospholipase